jgi:hypothetical protein
MYIHTSKQIIQPTNQPTNQSNKSHFASVVRLALQSAACHGILKTFIGGAGRGGGGDFDEPGLEDSRFVSARLQPAPPALLPEHPHSFWLHARSETASPYK